MKPFFYIARSGIKAALNTTVEGRARTGEISPKGLVAHTEDWDGRIAADTYPTTIRYVRDPDGSVRKMTFKEMVDRGYFHLGRGPSGMRRVKAGINGPA